MTTETDQITFDLLRARAANRGFHLQRHKVWDPCARGGDLYIMEQKARWLRGGNTGNPPSLMRYATAEQVSDFLRKVEQGK